MADRIVKLRRLRQILKVFGVQCNDSRGKGSHILFHKIMDGCAASYPVPGNQKDALIPYIRGCRKKFKLTAEDGVSDHDFYNA